ncbi:MAG: aminopeptidase P family N-terminal domain-containing protein, partial [Ardenticatenaceae bacterium]
MNILPGEFQARRERLLDHLHAEGLSGAVLFDNYYILYLTGFAFIPTERPVAFIINAGGDTAMFVPRLEVEHARSMTGFERVASYLEYPDDPHPMELLKQSLVEMGVSQTIGVDTDGYPWILGYRGAPLSELTGTQVRRIG